MSLNVVELFAGVGGFRIGLEGAPGSPRDGKFKVVWANQWEPSTKRQHAAEVYTSRWNLEPELDRPNWYHHPEIDDDVFVNDDIASIDAADIPEHDLLCGGFPCQDYSVAKTLDKAEGLTGQKGVLWWEIHRIVKHHKPRYLLLENVDRLLKSPKGQRGRDFAVMLASLDELGYTVEWRMIVASEYGFPQRRKRVFIFAEIKESVDKDMRKQIALDGMFARAFPIQKVEDEHFDRFKLKKKSTNDLADVTKQFNNNSLKDSPSPFKNSGMMVDGIVETAKTLAFGPDELAVLGDVLQTPGKISDEFILTAESLKREKGWIYLKGSKKEMRTGTDNFTYRYSEGPITFPDALDRASRTIVTGEGGLGPSRFKHVVTFKPTKKQVERLNLRSKEAREVRDKMNLNLTQWMRRLTPVELERLNGFPDNHTAGMTDGTRAFFMGNALVCDIVRRIGDSVHNIPFESNPPGSGNFPYL
jgi:DNA (cytosine-5)-methyltransferase 1